MKNLLVICALCFSSLAQAQSFKNWEVVYDKITGGTMNVDYEKNGLVYLINPQSPESPWYSLPREKSDLVKRVKLAGPIQEGTTVSFYNQILKRFDVEKVKFTFANGMAHLHLTTFDDASIRDYIFMTHVNNLGYEIPNIAGLNVKKGDTVCSTKRTPRFRPPGYAGTAVKFFTNGTVQVMYKNLFWVKNYETIPMEDISTRCKK